MRRNGKEDLTFDPCPRNCVCRLCDREIPKNTEKVVHWYTYRQNGMNIILCVDCVNWLKDRIEQK